MDQPSIVIWTCYSWLSLENETARSINQLNGTSAMCSSSLVVLLLSSFSIFQQNCKHSFIIPSRILETEPMSKKDCEISAAKYLKNSQCPSTFISNNTQQSQKMSNNYIIILFLLKLRVTEKTTRSSIRWELKVQKAKCMNSGRQIRDTLLTY